jgi:hypothetical protein
MPDQPTGSIIMNTAVIPDDRPGLATIALSISLSGVDRLSENRPLVYRRAGGGSGRRGYRLGHGALGARSGVVAFAEGVETRTPRYPHHLISGGTRLCCIYLLS